MRRLTAPTFILVLVAGGAACSRDEPARATDSPKPARTLRPEQLSPPSAPKVPAKRIFTRDSYVQSRDLYKHRVVDQATPRAEEQRAEDIHFKIRTWTSRNSWFHVATNVADYPNGPYRGRGPHLAVPLGIVQKGPHRSLAVLTTRCVIDHYYPHEHDRVERSRFTHVLLEIEEGRPHQVFRLAAPRHLAGRNHTWIGSSRGLAESFGGRRGLYHLGLKRALAKRLAFDLMTGKLPGVIASLPDGEWSSKSGTDLTVLYFPLADPGSKSLQPERHLGIADPEQYVREVFTYQRESTGFKMVSMTEECVETLGREFRAEQSKAAFMTGVAVFAAVAAVAVIAAPVAASGGAALAGGAGSAGASAVGGTKALGPLYALVKTRMAKEAAGVALRVALRSLAGEQLRDVLWDEAGQLIINYLGEGGGAEQIAVAGVSRLGLSDEQADSVAETVRSLLREGESTISVMTTGERDEGVGSIMIPERQLDISAELLRRGSVRLRTDQQAILRQQPGLVQAALEAIEDDRTREMPALSSREYEDLVRALARRLGAESLGG